VQEKPDVKSYLSGCGITFALFATWLLICLVVETVAYFGGLYEDTFTTALGIVRLTYTFIFAVLAWKFFRNSRALDAIGLSPDKRSVEHFFLGTLSGFGGVAFALFIIFAAGGLEFTDDSIIGKGGNVDSYSLVSSAFLFMIFALSEDILNRGLLYPYLKNRTTAWFAIVFTSVLFMSFHLFNPSFAIIPAMSIFLAGVLMCLLRDLTGNLWLSWGFHFGWNMLQAGLGIQVSGIYVHIRDLPVHITLSGNTTISGGEFGVEGGIAGLLSTAIMIIISIILVRRKFAAEN
jgi:hypothetical protein